VEGKADFDELACLFNYSDVMINHFSTVSLEAAICDLPTIQVGYDSYTYGQTFNTSAAFQRRQTHNLRRLRLEAAKVAEDQGQLIRSLDSYLQDRTLDQARRREYALLECGSLDGQSGDRLAAMIKSLLS
jgi:CDP-glycerol glycerophosphotransferase (TagB/SpsB family)